MANKLDGKVALVTGGSRGIGRSHALRLAQLGASVVVNDINLEAYKEFGEKLSAPTVVEEVKALGVPSIGIETDVTNKEQVSLMIKQILDEFGHIDIMINNAGGLVGDSEQSYASMVSEKDLRVTLDLNLIGTIFCCQAVAEPMKARKWGRIVNTSSHGGLWGQPGGVYSSYGAAKAGVTMYTKYLAQELAPYDVTVNCIAPGYVSTGRLEAKSYNRPGHHGSRESVLAQIPMGRLAQPEDVSKIMEFFVTDLADFVTGQCLSVCGGLVRF
ncbi:SDR family NAD(P)-dependent oxidoreductase [Chloroflexota bacterium]